MGVIKRNIMHLICFLLVFGFMVLFKHEEHVSADEAFAIEVILSQLENEKQEQESLLAHENGPVRLEDSVQVTGTTHSLQQSESAEPTSQEEATGEEQRIPDTYTVAPGDTLSEISVKFGIPVDKLKEINRLTGDTIRVGQVLYLKENSMVSNTP